jgi:hypothetical protein
MLGLLTAMFLPGLSTAFSYPGTFHGVFQYWNFLLCRDFMKQFFYAGTDQQLPILGLFPQQWSILEPSTFFYSGTSHRNLLCWDLSEHFPMLGLPTANTTAGTCITAISYIKKRVKQLRTNRQTEYCPASHGDWLRKQVVGQLFCGEPLGLVEKATNLHNLLAPNDSLILPPISTCHFGHLTTQSCYLFQIFCFLTIFSLSSLSSNLFLSLTIYRLTFTLMLHSDRLAGPFRHLTISLGISYILYETYSSIRLVTPTISTLLWSSNHPVSHYNHPPQLSLLLLKMYLCYIYVLYLWGWASPPPPPG